MYYGLRVESVDEIQERDHSNESSLSISLMLCRFLRDSLQIPFSRKESRKPPLKFWSTSNLYVPLHKHMEKF